MPHFVVGGRGQGCAQGLVRRPTAPEYGQRTRLPRVVRHLTLASSWHIISARAVWAANLRLFTAPFVVCRRVPVRHGWDLDRCLLATAVFCLACVGVLNGERNFTQEG